MYLGLKLTHISEAKTTAKQKVGEKLSDARRDEDESAGVLTVRRSERPQEQRSRWRLIDSRVWRLSQANKSIRRMPRRQEPMKDGVSSEKSWRAASRH